MPQINQGSAEHDGLTGIKPNQHHPLSRPLIETGHTNVYFMAGWNYRAVTTQIFNNNTLWMVPVQQSSSVTVDRIAIQVTSGASAGSVARLGIYGTSVQSNGLVVPNTLELDAGVVAIDSTGRKEITIDHDLAAGYYLLVVNVEGTPTLQAIDVTDTVIFPLTGIGTSLSSPNLNHSFLGTVSQAPDEDFPTPPLDALNISTLSPPIIALRMTP